jgi:thiol-disulfide isomerase/thioredoxin
MFWVLIVIIIILILVLIAPREAMTVFGYGEQDLNNTRRVYLHYTTWCKYCAIMKPVWADVKSAVQDSGIQFIEVDEGGDIRTPGITSYPTIIMLDEKGRRVKYHGGPDFAKLRAWIVSPNPQDF